MSTVQLPDGAPAVPPKVRTIAYFTSFITGAVGGMVVGIVGVVTATPEPSPAALTAGIVGVLTAGIATIAGGLGAAYRPTAGMPRSADVWGDGTPVATTPVIGD